jgi:hypothetical protein
MAARIRCFEFIRQFSSGWNPRQATAPHNSLSRRAEYDHQRQADGYAMVLEAARAGSVLIHGLLLQRVAG